MTKCIANMPSYPAISIEGFASDYRAGETIEAHEHNAHQIVHAVTGVMRVTAENDTWVVPPRRALWIPARTVHDIRCVSLVKMRTIYLTGDHPSFSSEVQVTNVSALMREIMVRLAEGAKTSTLPHLAALLVEEIPTLNVEPVCLPGSKDERIAPLISVLQKNPADQTSLHGWAERLGMSRRTLIRRIQDETGMSFRELRRQARILSALERLALDESVTNVAIDVGFDSPSAFIQAFRSITGKTPGRYMK